MTRKIVPIRKECATCHADLGVVFPQRKYCSGCLQKRIRRQKNEYARRLERSSEPIEFSPPSPCYFSSEGREERCRNFDLCAAKFIACRSYWKYFHHKVGHFEAANHAPMAYLALPRDPNKGYYEASFGEDYPIVVRREGVRMLEGVSEEFEARDFVRVDSFLVGREKRSVLASMVKAGVIKYLYGGKPSRNHPEILHTATHYGPPTYEKITPQDPAVVKAFFEAPTESK